MIAPNPLAEGPAPPAKRAALAVLGFFGLALLLAAAMARPVFYDEDPFLAAGWLVSRGLVPYRDFVLLDAPLLPLLLGGLFKLVGGWYVLTARLLTFALAAGSGAVLWALVRRLGAGRLMAAVLLGACLTSPFLRTPLATSRNDALPLFLFVLGFLLHLRAEARHPENEAPGERRVGRRWLGRFGAGLLMGLAAEASLTYVFAPAALLVHAAFLPAKRLLPVLAGLVLASVPGAVLLALSGWDRVRFGLFDYPALATPAWYWALGLEQQLALPQRLQAALSALFLDGNLTLLVLSVVLVLLTMARKRNWKRPGQLLVFMLLLAAVLAFRRAPAWPMYFAPLVPLLACSIAHLDRVTTYLAHPFRKRVLIGLAALPVLPPLLASGPEVVRAVRGEWSGVAAHRTALAVRAALPQGGAVATLFPHQVMDANALLPSLSTGPLIFRTGGLFTPATLDKVHALSAATLDAAFRTAPPAAIFAGSFATVFRVPMDAGLTDWAQDHGWRLVETDRSGARLWVP